MLHHLHQGRHAWALLTGRVAACRFPETLALRSKGDAEALAAVLSAASPGRTPPLWNELSLLPTRVLFVAGQLDAKYVELGKRMSRLWNSPFVEGEGAGHAVHLERPEVLLRLLAEVLCA